jgi:hypothetical protein
MVGQPKPGFGPLQVTKQTKFGPWEPGKGPATQANTPILKMSNTTSKLKPMDLGLKDEFLIHLVFASLPKEYETFIVNYNM